MRAITATGTGSTGSASGRTLRAALFSALLGLPVPVLAAEPPPAPPETAAQARDQIKVLEDPDSYAQYGTTAAHSAYKTKAGEPANAQGQVALPENSGQPTVAQLDPASLKQNGGDPTADDVLARGKYLVDMADCGSCHSRPGGHRFAGGLPMDMPFGTIYTPNITPDKEFGMGKYTEADLTRVFRRGVNRVGNNIYPGMPYPWYASMRQEDIHAIYAYLMSQAPIHYRVPHDEIYFPFTIRPLISVWNALFVPSGEFKDDPNHSALVNRGDYIVNSFAHCSECHNGYTLLGNGAQAKPLQGGIINKWATPNITNSKISGLGRYTDDQIFRFLKYGADDVMGTSVGPMRETTDVSLSKMRDEDIRAIIAYLRTQDRPATYSAYKRLAYQKPNPPGANIYFSQCASCHGVDGRGQKGIVPALDGNGMVLAAGPHNIIDVIIGGVEAKGSFGVMPALGTGMTNQQIADVSNYVRQAWSNDAPPNATAYQVAVNRREADGVSGNLLNGERTGGCPALDLPPLQTVLADASNGVMHQLETMTLPTMLQTVDSIIKVVRERAPDLKPEQITNGLTTAYCPVVFADPTVPDGKKSWQLGNFSTRVYTQLRTGGAY